MLDKITLAAVAALAAAALPSSATVLCALPSATHWPPEVPKLRGRVTEEIDFRGSFRDLSLYVGADTDVFDKTRRCFDVGDGTGLWVLELSSHEALANATAAMSQAGIRALHTAGNSVVADGGISLPSTLGLDACGAEVGVAVIPVSPKSLGKSAATMDVSAWKATERSETIDEALAAVNASELELSVRALAAFGTRLSYSDEVRAAAEFGKSEFETRHPGSNVYLSEWRKDMGANVVAEIPGTDLANEIIVAGAHFDSRNEKSDSNAVGDAPGADDNASGSSAMLEIARVLYKTGLSTRRTLRIVLFCGEEQGLLGSRALAEHWKDKGDNARVVAMVNADMLGWQIPGEPITLGFKDRYITPELTELARELTATYVGLPTEYSSSCCSDYLSFYEAGVPAVGFFENPVAASAYPHYHTRTDLPEYVNFEQLELETKAVLATVLTLAEIDA